MINLHTVWGEAARTSAEGDRHNCCCEHVVDNLEAMPAPLSEKYAVTRDKYYSCPHRDVTPLEIFLNEVRRP